MNGSMDLEGVHELIPPVLTDSNALVICLLMLLRFLD